MEFRLSMESCGNMVPQICDHLAILHPSALGLNTLQAQGEDVAGVHSVRGLSTRVRAYMMFPSLWAIRRWRPLRRIIATKTSMMRPVICRNIGMRRRHRSEVIAPETSIGSGAISLDMERQGTQNPKTIEFFEKIWMNKWRA